MLACLLLSLVALSAPGEGQRLLEAARDSVFTVEVLSGSGASSARDVLGSGYLVSAEGLVVTNYHVVGAFIDDPGRYRIRVRNRLGSRPARLRRFDLINDLALLDLGPVPTRPLSLAAEEPRRGASIVSLGDPEGLGLSLVEGVFNGYAERGFVDRQLLSMPLNSGMSGGPVLDRRGRVIGTNVSIIWLANSLSFGVPVAKVRDLLEAADVAPTPEGLRAEVTRQLEALEGETSERVTAAFGARKTSLTVGALVLPRPPEIFDCWNSSEVFEDEGVTRRRHGCNLQFTPTVERIGEVGSVELAIEELSSRGSSLGFYAALADGASSTSEIPAREPNNGVWSAPACTTERVRTAHLTWKVNTCASAYVRHPGLFNFDLVATTVSRPRQGALVTMRGRGLGTDSFLRVVRVVLAGARWGDAP
jgi:serine protease Do